MSFIERELPIGSLVFYNDGEHGEMLCQIDWLDLKSLAEKPEWFNGCHKPIPLTEEWLVRMGFEKRTDNLSDYSMKIKMAGNNYLLLGQSDGLFSIHKPSGTFGYGGMIHFRSLYVHSVQNAVHALTGQELTVKTDEV